MKHSLKERRIKQKENQLFRELSNLIIRITQDEPNLSRLNLTRVQLSADKSRCTAFFYDPEGPEKFKDIVQSLVLYKPSLRKSLASILPSRYTPELIFKYDALYDKQRKIDTLIRQIMTDKTDTKD